MGMYDSVLMRCKCGSIVEFQSKSGDCTMDSYEFDYAPANVLAGICDGYDTKCKSCGRVYQPKLASSKVDVTLNGERRLEKFLYGAAGVVLGFALYVWFVRS